MDPLFSWIANLGRYLRVILSFVTPFKQFVTLSCSHLRNHHHETYPRQQSCRKTARLHVLPQHLSCIDGDRLGLLIVEQDGLLHLPPSQSPYVKCITCKQANTGTLELSSTRNYLHHTLVIIKRRKANMRVSSLAHGDPPSVSFILQTTCTYLPQNFYLLSLNISTSISLLTSTFQTSPSHRCV